MKAFVVTLAMLVASTLQAQTVHFSVLNGVDTDMCFFDVLSINTSTGEVTTHGIHNQGFDAVREYILKVQDGDILIIQSRTHKDRELIGEFSAVIDMSAKNKLNVIEPSDKFTVLENASKVEAVLSTY